MELSQVLCGPSPFAYLISSVHQAKQCDTDAIETSRKRWIYFVKGPLRSEMRIGSDPRFPLLVCKSDASSHALAATDFVPLFKGHLLYRP